MGYSLSYQTLLVRYAEKNRIIKNLRNDKFNLQREKGELLMLIKHYRSLERIGSKLSDTPEYREVHSSPRVVERERMAA